MEDTLGFKRCFKKVKKNLILNSYYTKKMKNGKTMKASIFDWIFTTMILVLFFLITIFNTTKNIIWSIVITGVLIFFYLLGLINIKNRSRNKSINKINEEIWEEEIIKRIEKYSDYDYLLYMKELLEEYYNCKLIEYDNNIDFIGEINKEVYGIKCIKSSVKSETSLKDLEYYIRGMKKNNIEEGIIVSNSYFNEEVRENTNYLLIDFDQIKNILIKIGEFPTKDKLEEKIIIKYEDEKDSLKEKLSIYKKDKIYKFILLGIALYFISPLVSYTLYYKIMGIILISIGITIGIYNLIIYLNHRKTYS